MAVLTDSLQFGPAILAGQGKFKFNMPDVVQTWKNIDWGLEKILGVKKVESNELGQNVKRLDLWKKIPLCCCVYLCKTWCGKRPVTPNEVTSKTLTSKLTSKIETRKKLGRFFNLMGKKSALQNNPTFPLFPSFRIVINKTNKILLFGYFLGREALKIG